ncbi:SurA N-terminal domain-containing protein [Sphingomonas sp.]|uniref:peptidylprolyl isomerase n=1 Tax=Sphingomonas sp. TaxID=28214 RepID=UPI003B3A62F0
MLAFFRRALSSWLAVGLLALIMLAFVATGVGTPGGSLTGGPSADAVATVGGRPISVNVISERAQTALRQAREQQPALTMPQFLASIGGLNPLVEQSIGAAVLSAWAERHGLAASERLIGSEIASFPAFRGATGKFDENAMNALLNQRRMNFNTFHDDVRDELIRRQLLNPIMTGTRAPDGLLRIYAQSLIDKREGVIGLVAAAPAGIPTPTDQQVADYYRSHIARYSLPERHALRYALIGPDSVSPPAPTEAEIAAQYKADAAKYAASETRTIQRVVLPNEAAAKAFATAVAKGTSFAQAAAGQGLAAADINAGTVTKDAFAASDGAAIAAAAFALPSGGTTAPVQSPLGWSIAHVEAIKAVPARSLDQVRSEIAAALTKKKADDALGKLVQQVEDAVGDGANFNEVVAQHKLQAVTTPPLLPNGTAPSDPNFKADPTIAALLKATADSSADDAPTVETLDQNGHFALVGVASVVAAAPVPLAQIKPRVAEEIIFERAAARAKTQAQSLLGKINGGQAPAAAFQAAGMKAPQPLSLSQIELSRAGADVPAPIRTLFRLAPGKADLVQGPNGSWFVVKLDRIAPGDAKMLPMVIGATRSELQRGLGDEYAQQFANAARVEVKVKRNLTAQGKLEQDLRSGNNGGGAQ